MGDASSTHDPREKPAATRGTKRKAKRDYVLLLMVEAVGDADHESFLTLLIVRRHGSRALLHEKWNAACHSGTVDRGRS